MIVKHDAPVAIATGRNRKELHWKNRDILWSELVEKLSHHHRTAETYKTYQAARKARRDEIKDIGGFVGGMLAGGRRKAGSVTFRTLITLDADFATEDFWENFCFYYGNAALCYSTHSHTTEKQRLRLVMPLKRELLPDEYEPVTRKIADMLGIDQFDDTTYQTERLMYWPSAAADGDVLFEFQDGPWLDPDPVLAAYRDWRDSSQWPTSGRQHEIISREIKKQEDPLGKPGIVGAFCRAFTIGKAIERFLSELYEPSDIADRYTYTHGSTAAGLVVYDDKFAYSHHGTDPAGGKLCNAFDLVRLHLFGDRDEDSNAKGNVRPSYQAMIDVAVTDAEVKKLLAAEKWQDAKADFEGADRPDEDMDWMAGLETDRKGNYLSNVFNLKYILENDPRLKKRIAFNEFSRKPNVLKPLPWDKIEFKKPREWEDTDQAIIENYLSLRPYELNISSLKVRNVLEEIRKVNSFHPVRQYLSGLKWDGLKRVDTLFIDFLGCADTPYTRAVTRKTLTAAVARIMTPGCKFDYVLTLLGEEGIGKSTVFKKLGKDWFTDTFNFKMITMGTKQAYEQLQGCWIIEIPEMTGLRKADENAVKGFLTSTSDNYRASHKQETLDRQRQNIFVGSSNNMDFLKAGTGNRRFWPLPTRVQKPTKAVLTELTPEVIDQVWAEAFTRFQAGETLYLDKELEAEARKMQRQHTEEDAWTDLIKEYLEKLLPENWKTMGEWERRGYIHNPDALAPKGVIQRDRVSVKEIWTEALEGKFSQISNEARRNISRIMDNMEGWEKLDGSVRMITGEKQKGWFRKEIGVFANSGKDLKNTDDKPPF